MKKSQQLVRVLHIPNPSIPSTIFESVSEASQHKDDWENWVRRMNARDDIRDNFAKRGDDGYSKLPEAIVNSVIQKGSKSVAHEWREEDERYGGISLVIVCFELNLLSVECLTSAEVTNIRYQRLWII